jgi:hypothetical protein
MKKASFVGGILFVGVGVIGCGVEKPDAPTVTAGSPEIESKAEFLTWNPEARGLNLHLVDKHTCWHFNACEVACGDFGFGRKCSSPGRGEDFIAFHRQYLNDLRNEFEAQHLSADITPWRSLPSQMKDPNNGWDSTIAAAEANVLAMKDPTTGKRFASLDAYGAFIESNYHGQLHAIAAKAWASTDSAIADITTSPTSTYFFKIHGYIDYLAQRYQRGDFDKDGNADLIETDTTGGMTQIWTMNGTAVKQKIDLGNLGSTGCGSYIGAIGDFNFDGNMDVVWHHPLCNQTIIWQLGGTAHSNGDILLPGVDSTWKLIGSADYNSDGRPDLVWNQIGTSTLQFWVMNGSSRLSTKTITDPVPGWVPVAPIDVNNDMSIDIVMMKVGPPKQYKTLKFNGALGTNGTSNVYTGNFPTDANTTLVGVGRFQSALGSSWSDLLFRTAGSSPKFSFGLEHAVNSNPQFDAVAGANIGSNVTFQGPR